MAAKGTPPAVRVHDFPTDAEGKAIPCGIYDMARNEALVSVARDQDTPALPWPPFVTGGSAATAGGTVETPAVFG